jgi:predicted XRE-type DNA-binding protein
LKLDIGKPLFSEEIAKVCHKAGRVKGKPKGGHLPQPRLAAEKVKQVQELLDKGLSQRKIAKLVGINQSSVSNIGMGNFKLPETKETVEPLAHDAIRKLLRKQSMSEAELADALDCSPKRVREVRVTALRCLHGTAVLRIIALQCLPME